MNMFWTALPIALSLASLLLHYFGKTNSTVEKIADGVDAVKGSLPAAPQAMPRMDGGSVMAPGSGPRDHRTTK